MEYDDELERMKARKNQKPRQRQRRPEEVPASSDIQLQTETREKIPSHSDIERMRRQRIQQKRKKKKRRILMAELFVLAALLICAYWFFIKRDTDGYWTVAVFGVDSRDGNLKKGALSDVEMICNIDRKTGEIKLVSVYRDTYLKINSKGTYHKINEAYFKGGPDQALAALNENLDLSIDDYATFNWKTVAEAINILGGIDLEITDKEFAYINSFITETVESTGIPSVHLKKAGMNHLDGVQAVAYSRLRLMDTDFNRTERQRKVVTLALEKAKQADFSVLNNILVTVLPNVATSIGISDLIPIAKGIGDYHITETAGFPFARTTTKIGKMDCVIPLTLESNVVQLHQFLFNEENYSPSSAVKKISQKIAEDSGFSEEGKNAETGSGNSGSSNSKPKKETQAPVEETTPVETTTAEETTEEETTIAATTQEQTTEKPTNEDGSLIGPGAGIEQTKETTKETTKAAETQPPKESPKETTEETPEASKEVGPGVS